jgi:pimeloyl-ACP methyl ester carboxylesterase
MTYPDQADSSMRTDDMRFAYYRCGQGAQTVVLLHGWPQTSYTWRQVAPLLSSQFDVVVPDLPGFGSSSKPDGGFDKKTISRRLRDFIAALGLSRVALVGHDLGGAVAYAYAAQWPQDVSHLVFVESSLPSFGQEEAMDVSRSGSWHFGFNMAGDISETLVSGREYAFIDHFMRRENVGLFDPTSVEDSVIEHYARALARPGALRCSFGYYRTLAVDRVDNHHWGRTPLPMPVLAVGATWGYGAASAQTMRRVATDVRDVVIDRSGHYVPEEQPTALADAITQFIDDDTREGH